MASTVEETENLKKNQGAVVKVNEKSVGAYRDQHGELHLLDLSCTHMGCDVEWNDGDATWDCPCHGSRFSAIGEVDRKSTRLNSSHVAISYAVFCLKKKRDIKIMLVVVSD